jgi:NAD+ synthase (glutamine-hydrolysing)
MYFCPEINFMKITIAQLNYHVGDFSGNLEKMKKAVSTAKNEGSDLICFAELATCGYPPRDFLNFADFIQKADECVQELAKLSDGIGILVGSPTRNPVPEGKDLYNSGYFLSDGEVAFIQHKALLPTYDVFDEYRYFQPADYFSTFTYKGVRIALTICEDMWNVGNENPLYTICPMDELMKENPDVMINLSASPFAYDHAPERIHVLRTNVLRYKLPLFYVNQVGAQTELIFDGGSLVFSANGKIFDELPFFENCIRTYSLSDVNANDQNREISKDKYPLIHDALLLGLKDYFGKLGLSKAILGLSGGIDSAVTAVLAARALGKENVSVVLMPSEFSSDHSIEDARILAENLGISHTIFPINELYDSWLKNLQPHFKDLPFGLAEENLQARIRGTLLMAFSNKFGPILLNTSNKSEMAVGYGTLYGDMCGGLSVIGDLYKTEVYELAAFINKDEILIPLNTLTKPPSAELRPGQKDADSLPDYAILDQILYLYIEKNQGPNEIISAGFDAALVARILRLVNINEFKRHQTAPVLRISPKAFGMGRRMPIEGKYLNIKQ